MVVVWTYGHCVFRSVDAINYILAMVLRLVLARISSFLTTSSSRCTYVSSLDDELDVVTERELLFGLSFGVVEEYLLDDVGALDEAKVVLH